MRFSTTLTAIAAATISFTHAYSGFNVGANNPDGSCKTTADWENAFNALRGLLPGEGGTTNVRLYQASDCDALANAVPAALKTNTLIMVGIWTEDANHYAAEKNALSAAIENYGTNWTIAISVGSEDLLNRTTSPATLVNQIAEIRLLAANLGVEQPVGHTDTYEGWVQSSSSPVIEEADFIGLNYFPYWAGDDISFANAYFWESVQKINSTVHPVSPGTPIWITETGWPVSGAIINDAVPSIYNAQKYWSDVACKALSSLNLFWYNYQDYNVNPTFGVFGSNGSTLYGGSC